MIKILFFSFLFLNLFFYINTTCIKKNVSLTTSKPNYRIGTTTKKETEDALLPFMRFCRNVKCGYNYYLDYFTCSCKCPEEFNITSDGSCFCGLEQCSYKNQVIDKQLCACICPYGYGFYNNECVSCNEISCPKNYVKSDYDCQCNCGLYYKNCENGFIADYNKCECICPETMKVIDGKCVCDLSCDSSKNFELIVSPYMEPTCKCDCKWGTFLMEDKCTECKNFNYVCPENYYLDEYSCACYCGLYECENGFQVDYDNCRCHCPKDTMIVIDGKCVCNLKCDESKNFEAVFGYNGNIFLPFFDIMPPFFKQTCSCNCKNGYYLNGDECVVCNKTCPENFYLDESTCSCLCNFIPICFDYTFADWESCTCPCPENLIAVNDTCICNINCDASKNFVAKYGNYFDLKTNSYCSCVCSDGYRLENDECVLTN